MTCRTGVAAGVCVLLVCGCGGEKTTEHAFPHLVIGHDTVSGKEATASASADAGQYRTFAARVTATPTHQVATASLARSGA
jgi:hypothetical protein